MTGFLDGGGIDEVSSSVDTGDIGHSLRLRGAQYLSKTITTDATSTFYFIVKRGKLGVISPIVESYLKFNANDTFTAFGLTTTAVFRDPTAFILIHVSNGGLYVDGTYLGAVTTSAITNGRIGFDGTNYFDGYLARFCVVGGTSSSYTNFKYLNTQSNEWVTKAQSQVKAVVDAGSANSFMLDFDNGTSLTTLGYDKSSKGNNWTLNNFSLTSGANYDWMEDTPSNNYATLNPLDKTSSVTVSDGNLSATCGSSPHNIFSTEVLPNTGKFYAEFVSSTATNGTIGIGFGISAPSVLPTADYNSAGKYSFYSSAAAYTINNGTLTGVTGYTNTAGLTFRLAVDVDAGKVWLGQGSVWWDSSGGTTGDPETGANPTFSLSVAGYKMFCHFNSPISFNWTANFGQRPYADQLVGFDPLCTANLSYSGTVTLSGSFTGNASADGPSVWMNGVPDTLTINGNAVTFGTHADKTAGGFKLRTSSASYNASGTNTWTATITSDLKNLFKYNNAQVN